MIIASTYNSSALIRHLIIISFCVLPFFQVITAQNSESKPGEQIVIDGNTYYLHKVAKGEGLYRISINFGVSQKELLEANPEASSGLNAGQLIRIPVIKGRNSSVAELKNDNFNYHTVEKGQTAYYISKKYGVALDTIYKYNPGSQQQLIEGAFIRLPKIKESTSLKDQNEGSFVYHEVKAKETLYGLSKKYNVAIADIIKDNPALKNGVLSLGSMVRIPTVKPTNDVHVETDLASVPMEDEQYIYHKIAREETLYSISQRYQAKIEDIKAVNELLDEGNLELGYLLRIPKESIRATRKDAGNANGLFILHKVKRKETLFAISRQYSVDVDILKKVNAEMDLTNLPKGAMLKVPTQEWFSKFYALKDVSGGNDEIVRKEDLAVILKDCKNYDYNINKPSLQVAVLLPFAVEKSMDVNLYSEPNSNGDLVEKVRKDKIISLKSKVFVEFYQGVLMAVDSLKNSGVNINLLVYDVSPNDAALKEVLESPEMTKVDLILGPAYPRELVLVSEFAKKHDIPVVYPFSSVNPELTKNTSLFQLSPIDSLLFEQFANHMVNDFKDKRVILIRTENKESAFENKLSHILREKIYWESFKKGNNPNFIEYNFKQDDLASLEHMFSADVENVVIIPSEEEAQVNRIITTVKGAVEKKGVNATLWGLPAWLKFQTIDPEDIHKLNGKIFSYYAVDYSDPRTKSILMKYRKWFKTEPIAISPYFQNATVQSNISRYSLWGYDISYYFMSALRDYGKGFEHCIDEHEVFGVQSNFQFKRLNNWSGFYNEGLYLLNFTKDYQLKIEALE